MAALNSFPMRLAVGVAFALAAAVLTNVVYKERDGIFEWSWAKARGKLEVEVSAQLAMSARDFAETKHPGTACVVKPVARDDRYLYAGVGCAMFKSTGESAPLEPTRLRLWGDSVSSLEEPDHANFENSVHRLFPPEVWEKLRYGFPKAQVLEAGLARMKEKSL
jgi:hypothetical protein